MLKNLILALMLASCTTDAATPTETAASAISSDDELTRFLYALTVGHGVTERTALECGKEGPVISCCLVWDHGNHTHTCCLSIANFPHTGGQSIEVDCDDLFWKE